MTYAPLWTAIVSDCDEVRPCNSHIENYFKQIKLRCRQVENTIGRLPVKCMRFIKTVKERNDYLRKQIIHEIPKTRLASNKKPAKGITFKKYTIKLQYM